MSAERQIGRVAIRDRSAVEGLQIAGSALADPA
jgi:hypothetical protein